MQQNNGTNEKTLVNTIKKPIAYNLQIFAALQINIIPLPVTMNRKIKPPVKSNFWQS